ncbi:MAG TPA: YceI family protein [Gaiellaceae bacterium]|nr:YceI family protein [Gaiellaceae bacterium]
MTTTASERRTATAGRWALDAGESSVDFAVKTFWGLATVRGRFDRFAGSYEMGPDGAELELTIDAASLDTGNATRDRHLRSHDFFGVAEHPQLRFRSTAARPAGAGMLHVDGVLEGAGAFVPVELDATVRPARDGLEIEGVTIVDHRQLGMSSGPLGMIRGPATVHVRARLRGAA